MEKYDTVLKTKDETLEALKQLRGNDWLKNFSEWVLIEYEEFIKTGEYPYLRQVCKFINERNGLNYDLENSTLSGLVYNAACVYRERKEISEGWMESTPENLEPFINKFVEKKFDSIIGLGISKRKVVKVGDRFYFMKPRARTRGCFATWDQKFRPLREGV